MNNPGEGVPLTLLHHVHLVSMYNYPILSHLPLETVAEYLLQAPTITREVAGMTWKFLDAPPDGSVMLVWQPPQLGTYAASDGYVWADAELAYCNEYKGYTVEMYSHKSGFRPQNEPIATHSRRRYRLTPAAKPKPNLPPCDSSLWIIHYSQTDPAHRVPVRGISITPAQTGSWNVRKQLQQHGQLVRKEFMLNDRAHWPTINPPSRNIAGSGSQSVGYPGNVISHLNRTKQKAHLQQQKAPLQQQKGLLPQQKGPSPQQKAPLQQQKAHLQQQRAHLQQQYAPSGRTRAPPVKRQRIAPPSHARPSAPIAAATLARKVLRDFDEDNSRGDFMDHLTPREISTTRFMINDENMEEIFNSPYSTCQIVPVPLGLGRKGEIEALTKDFFDATTNSTPPVPSGTEPPRVGRLAPGKADEFRARAAQKFLELETEVAELKSRHIEDMSKIRAGSIFMEEERRLRSTPMTPNSKNDDWIFDGSPRGTTLGDIATTGPRETVSEIASRAEKLLGQSIVVVQDVECVQKGGLEEKIENVSEGTDYDMIDTSANTNEPQGQSTSFIQQDPTPLDPIQSIGHTPQPMLDETEDVTMAEIPDVPDRKNSDTGSWVMVSKESHSGASQDQQMPALDSFVDLPATSAGAEQPGDSLHTPGNVLPGLTSDAPEINANDFPDTIGFGNLDTAGDALAGYGEEDDHGGMGLDDSAFGAAFHAAQPSPGPPTDSPAP